MHLCLLLNDLDLFVSCLKARGDGDTLGSFNFVTSQHPNLDASLAEHINGLKNVFLKLIFNTSHGKEVHFKLKTGNSFRNFFLTVDHASLGSLESCLEIVVHGLRDQFLRDDQSSQTVS